MKVKSAMKPEAYSHHNFEFPVLVGDIGGTNARFALVSEPGGAYHSLTCIKLKDYKSPVEAIGSVLTHYPVRPASAFLAVAAPVEDTCVELTNANWIIDADLIGKAHGFKQIALINDFPPVAAALSSLERHKDMLCLGDISPTSSDEKTKFVIGVGTGCGGSALIPVNNQWLLQPTEIGHTHLGPEGLLEQTLWPFLQDDTQPMSVETLLSGQGLLRLYQALHRLDSSHSDASSPGQVLEALQNKDPVARSTIDIFTSLLARVAGDMALLFQASEGIYIAGGVIPRFINAINKEAFRSSFENKPPFQNYLKNIPTFIITEEYPALSGLATLVACPQKFITPAVYWKL